MSSISQTWLLWGLLSFVLGALAGACEIVARYRDEPIQAILNRYGYFYITVNALLAFCGYLLLVHYPKQIFPPLQDDYVMTAIVAGFGSMVVLRSKFFVIKGDDGNDYSIGPGIAMETILHMLDRKIDRLRATERQKVVS